MEAVGYPTTEGAALPVAPPSKPKPNNLSPVSALRKKVASLSIDNLSEHRFSNASASVRSSLSVAEDESSVEEKSELESESEVESDEESVDGNKDDGFSSFDVHPMHCTPVPRQPLSFPGCKSAEQMATVAAADTNIGIRQNRLIRSRVTVGELFFTCQGKTQVVPLINSEVATCRCTGPMSKGMSVVVIVPPGVLPRPTSAASSSPSRRPSIKGMIFGRTNSDKKPDCGIVGWVFYCQSSELPGVLQSLGESGCIRSNLFSLYKSSAGKIGSGSFGSVMHATAIETGDMAAIKELKDGTKMESIQAEVNMLVRAQGHDKIIKFRGCFCEAERVPAKWFLVFDVHPYGDLYDRVASCTRMTEKDAMPLLRDLCEALKHLHENGIFHRDVKPENLLMANGRQKGVVLTDFGISCLVTSEAEMRKPLGTVGYASPEMLRGEATGWEGDAFGAGVVLYFMLSKSTPFLAPTSKLMVELTETCKVNMKYSCFDNISDDCRNLILNFLTKDHKERLTVEKALLSRIIRKTYVTATEPSLARMEGAHASRRAASKQTVERRQENYMQDKVQAVKPKHHLIALTAGELPELTRLHK